MKRIEFIAPVEAMRGNLSGKQDLVYPTNDNKAFDAPIDQKCYARNYRPSLIGAKRASNGLKYFAVKVKHAVHNTTLALKNMSIMAVMGILVSMLLNPLYRETDIAWRNFKAHINRLWIEHTNKSISLRKFIMNYAHDAFLNNTDIVIPAINGVQQVVIANPFLKGVRTGDATSVLVGGNEYISNFWEFLVKWWDVALTGIRFKVNFTALGTVTALGFAGTFDDFINSGNSYIISHFDWQLTTEGEEYVKCSDGVNPTMLYLTYVDTDGEVVYVTANDSISTKIVYTTTTQAPE